MSRYVSIDGYMAAIMEYAEKCKISNNAILLSPPSFDDMPCLDIVRCQHCRHNDLPETSPNVLCRKFYGMGYYNGFCSWGERRVDDE